MVRDEHRDEIGAAQPGESQDLLSAYGSEFVLVVSPAGEVIAGSADAMLGYTLERLGTHVGEYLHPDDLPQLFAVLERARNTYGYRDRIRLRARHADGTWRL